MFVRPVRTSHACNFQKICENDSQPGLQLVERLATPLVAVTFLTCDEEFFKRGVVVVVVVGGGGDEYESQRTLTRTK